MTQSTSKTPIIVCSDSLQEQARLSSLLSKDYDDIIGCQLAQLETLVQREPSASVVVGWQQPTAELRLIVDFCRRKSAPLLIVLSNYHPMISIVYQKKWTMCSCRTIVSLRFSLGLNMRH